MLFLQEELFTLSLKLFKGPEPIKNPKFVISIPEQAFANGLIAHVRLV